MLNVKIVSTSVLTAAWWRTHRTPSAISRLIALAGRAAAPCAGSRTRLMSSAPAATRTAWPMNGHADREQRGPQRRADELVDGDEARLDAGVGDGEVVAPDEHRQQGVRRVVG